MTRNETFDTFTRDIDRLLHEAGRADAGRPDAEYRKDLLLAAELAATDFSSDSAEREALRRRLLSVPATEPTSFRAWRRHPALVAASASVALLVVVLLAQPDLRAAVVEPTFRYLQRLVLGEHTEATLVAEPGREQLDAILSEFYRELEDGERWTIETAVGRLGGGVPAGRPAVLRTYNSLRLAESEAAFAVAKPGYLPDGYRFDSAVITPDDGVILDYRAPGGKRITLYQTPTGPDRATMTMSMGTGGTLVHANVGDRRAAWVNDHQLVWEGASASFTLEGTDLTQAEAVEIAESAR